MRYALVQDGQVIGMGFPERIYLPDGSVRTNLESLSDEELATYGYYPVKNHYIPFNEETEIREVSERVFSPEEGLVNIYYQVVPRPQPKGYDALLNDPQWPTVMTACLEHSDLNAAVGFLRDAVDKMIGDPPLLKGIVKEKLLLYTELTEADADRLLNYL